MAKEENFNKSNDSLDKSGDDENTADLLTKVKNLLKNPFSLADDDSTTDDVTVASSSLNEESANNNQKQKVDDDKEQEKGPEQDGDAKNLFDRLKDMLNISDVEEKPTASDQRLFEEKSDETSKKSEDDDDDESTDHLMDKVKDLLSSAFSSNEDDKSADPGTKNESSVKAQADSKANVDDPPPVNLFDKAKEMLFPSKFKNDD